MLTGCYILVQGNTVSSIDFIIFIIYCNNNKLIGCFILCKETLCLLLALIEVSLLLIIIILILLDINKFLFVYIC